MPAPRMMDGDRVFRMVRLPGSLARRFVVCQLAARQLGAPRPTWALVVERGLSTVERELRDAATRRGLDWADLERAALGDPDDSDGPAPPNANPHHAPSRGGLIE